MATVVTSLGKANITSGIKRTGTEPTFVGWGTGAGTANASDTTLFTEDSAGSPAYARVSGTSSQVTTSTTNDTYQLVATLTANASKTITNAGCFDAATSGNLAVKGDFSGVALNNNDSIQFTIQIQLT
jgi:hypothetical protein